MKLDEIRKRVDAIDRELIALLNDRADLVHEIGKLKRANGLAIYAPEREEKLLRSLEKMSKGRLPPKAIRAIYREIMSAALALETDLTIAYVGPESGRTEKAAREKFGASVKYIAQRTVGDVFDAVEQRRADYGVVPASGSGGGLGRTIERFEASDLRICAQVAGGDSEDLGAQFFVIGHQDCEPTGDDRTALVFWVRDRAGALFEALEPFKRLRINMRRIESRPGRRPGRGCCLFADIEGHARDASVKRALSELRAHCSSLKVLGSYPRRDG